MSDEFLWEERWRAEKGSTPLPAGVSSYLVAYRDDVRARRAFATGVQGCCVEVTDTYNIWSIARVMLVLDENRFLVWFEGWGSLWLMWLDRRYDLARVRGCQPRGFGGQPAGMGKAGPISEQQFLDMQEVCIQRVLGRSPRDDQATMYEGGKWDGVPNANVWQVPKGPPVRQNPVWPAPYWRHESEGDHGAGSCSSGEGMQRTPGAEWVDMEDPSCVVTGGCKEQTTPFIARLPAGVDRQRWAAQQRAAARMRPFVPSNRLQFGGSNGADRLPFAIRRAAEVAKAVSTGQDTAVAARLYRLSSELVMTETWNETSETVGVLTAGEEVEIAEIVSGSKYFPDLGDLRAAARVPGRGWFMVRNKAGKKIFECLFCLNCLNFECLFCLNFECLFCFLPGKTFVQQVRRPS
eukprot:SAG31_NODE_438_length_15693_cov_6.254248_13_plen_407_part_00